MGITMGGIIFSLHNHDMRLTADPRGAGDTIKISPLPYWTVSSTMKTAHGTHRDHIDGIVKRASARNIPSLSR